MFFQILSVSMGLIIGAILLILFDMLLLKIGLAITKAQVRKNIKWVAISFLIQFGVILFISSPLLLNTIIGTFHGEGNIIIIVVFFSVFIDVNVINLIHQIGIKRSIIVMIFVVVPIISAIYTLGRTLGGAY
ncbi:MAG: hypothetical protein ACFE9Q_05395 [Candidatus Hodarchaeota archaeon]